MHYSTTFTDAILLALECSSGGTHDFPIYLENICAERRAGKEKETLPLKKPVQSVGMKMIVSSNKLRGPF